MGWRENMTLRPAEKRDLPQLLDFEQDLIAYERAFAPQIKKGKIHYYDIGAYIERSDVCVVVAEHNQQLIGSGYALIKPNKVYKNPSTFVYLGFMYVLPEFRGNGINGRIIEYLVDWGKAQGHTEFQLDVYAENQHAIRAYQKMGFQSELLTMRFQTDS